MRNQQRNDQDGIKLLLRLILQPSARNPDGMSLHRHLQQMDLVLLPFQEHTLQFHSALISPAQSTSQMKNWTTSSLKTVTQSSNPQQVTLLSVIQSRNSKC